MKRIPVILFLVCSLAHAEDCVDPYLAYVSPETAAILRIDNDQRKRSALDKHGESIAASLTENQVDVLCSIVNLPKYRHFTQTVDWIKSETVKAEDATDLTYAEFAYFVACDEGQNPLLKNINPRDIFTTAEGLSETTLELIRASGPLLLEIQPDGQTLLEHVQMRLDNANAKGLSTQGIYSSERAYVSMGIDRIEEKDEAYLACLDAQAAALL